MEPYPTWDCKILNSQLNLLLLLSRPGVKQQNFNVMPFSSNYSRESPPLTSLHEHMTDEKEDSSLKENAEDIAKLITLENGKPLADARGEVVYGCTYISDGLSYFLKGTYLFLWDG